MRRILTKSALVLGLLCSLPTLVIAQGWQPTRPIKMICPFPAGGGTDQIARIVAQQLTTRSASRSMWRTAAAPTAASAPRR